MKIAILGYGRMGKTIERIALSRGHEIVLKISSANQSELTANTLQRAGADLAIDFSLPSTACRNIITCFEASVPVVSGTTAWLQDWDKTIAAMEAHKGTFLYASNFSIGVNLFFALNKQLAKLMDPWQEYVPSIHEVHHTGKLDAPSGTAITLAEGLLSQLSTKKSWTKEIPMADEVQVTSDRIDPAPGTHHIRYTSPIDEIEIIHTAKSRDGFALGAVLAAEYLEGKTGLHTMAQVLKIT